MTGERGSDGVTRQSKSEGDRNHTQREADGYKWTKSHGEREEGGREGETEEVGVGREQKSGVTGGHRTPPPTLGTIELFRDSSHLTAQLWNGAPPGDNERLSQGAPLCQEHKGQSVTALGRPSARLSPTPAPGPQ